MAVGSRFGEQQRRKHDVQNRFQPWEREEETDYKLTPKIRGALPLKNWGGAKTGKISVDFIQPPTLIAN